MGELKELNNPKTSQEIVSQMTFNDKYFHYWVYGNTSEDSVYFMCKMFPRV